MTTLDGFHHLNKDGTATTPFDDAIYQHLISTEHIVVIGTQIYIYENGIYKLDATGAKLKTKIKECLYPEFKKSNFINRIYGLFPIDAGLVVKPTEMNLQPAHWILFKNGYYDPVKKEMYPLAPSYRSLNQIPHTFIPYEHPRGDTVDEWLEFIAPDPDDREMLLEFCGYCLTRDTRQQKFLILCGTGGSGKSTVIKMLETVVGADNISNISLKELGQRFGSFNLMGKLLNSCADLEIDALKDVSLVKKALGEDTLSIEAKGEMPISFRNCAKFIFSTNQLPLVLSETTNGFYRRLLVLKMDRLPSHTKHDFLETLQAEKDHFIHLIVEALGRMYAKGTIAESENSFHAVRQLWKDSDSVQAWLDDDMVLSPESRLERGYLYERYQGFCRREGRQPLSNKAFYSSLRSKRFMDFASSGSRYFKGIATKESALSFSDKCSERISPHDDPTLPY